MKQYNVPASLVFKGCFSSFYRCNILPLGHLDTHLLDDALRRVQ